MAIWISNYALAGYMRRFLTDDDRGTIQILGLVQTLMVFERVYGNV